MRLFAAPVISAFTKAALLTSVALVAHEDAATRPVLAGAWSIDKTLSTAPGSVGMPRREEDRARRALLEELIALPPKFTIAQDGDKVVFIEPDGVVRTFVVNDRTEKHQLQHGTIETKSRWDGNALEMELTSTGGLTLTRRYEVRGTPRQLEVTTTASRGPKNAKRVAVYDVTDDVAASPL
jgi:hypothetical protein